MDTSEKRFEFEIEQYLISHGYEQFNGQAEDGTWVHNRQHDVAMFGLGGDSHWAVRSWR